MSEKDDVDIEEVPFEVDDKDAVLDDVPMEHEEMEPVDEVAVEDDALGEDALDDEDLDEVDFEEEEDGPAVATARRDLNLAVNTVLNQQVNSLARTELDVAEARAHLNSHRLRKALKTVLRAEKALEDLKESVLHLRRSMALLHRLSRKSLTCPTVKWSTSCSVSVTPRALRKPVKSVRRPARSKAWSTT